MHKVIIETEDGCREVVGVIVSKKEEVEIAAQKVSRKSERVFSKTGNGTLNVTIVYSDGPTDELTADELSRYSDDLPNEVALIEVAS